MYGHSDDEWDRLVDDAVSFLTEQAQSKHITSYSELNSALTHAGHLPFNFGLVWPEISLIWELVFSRYRTEHPLDRSSRRRAVEWPAPRLVPLVSLPACS